MGDWWVAWRDPSGAHAHVDLTRSQFVVRTPSPKPQPPPPSTEGHYLLILAADFLSHPLTPTPLHVFCTMPKKKGGRSVAASCRGAPLSHVDRCVVFFSALRSEKCGDRRSFLCSCQLSVAELRQEGGEKAIIVAETGGGLTVNTMPPIWATCEAKKNTKLCSRLCSLTCTITRSSLSSFSSAVSHCFDLRLQ